MQKMFIAFKLILYREKPFLTLPMELPRQLSSTFLSVPLLVLDFS